MKEIITKCELDPGIALVIDLYLQESKSNEVLSHPKRVYLITKLGLNRRPVCVFPNTVQSAALLYYFHMLRRPEEYGTAELKEMLDPVYDEMGESHRDNRENWKLMLVLETLGHVKAACSG